MSPTPRALSVIYMCCLLSAGCAGIDVASVGSVVPEPEPSYLVQVLTQAPDEAYLLVITRVAIDPLDKRPITEALGEERLDALRTIAAQHGAERLLLDESRVRGERWAYGLGISKTLTSHLGLTPPACEGLGLTEAKARVARRASLCLRDLATRRRSLSAKVHVRFRVDPFGDLMRAAALPSSSRDSQVQECVTEALESVSYPRPPSLICTDDLQIRYP